MTIYGLGLSHLLMTTAGAQVLSSNCIITRSSDFKNMSFFSCISCNVSVAVFDIHYVFSELQMDFLYVDRVNDVHNNVLKQQLIRSCAGDFSTLSINVFLSSSCQSIYFQFFQ